MKKLLLFSLALMLGVATTYGKPLSASTHNNNDHKFGIKWGLNFSKPVSLSKKLNIALPSNAVLISPHVGGFWERNLSDNTGIQVALSYLRQGDGSLNRSVCLDYILLSPIFRYYAGEDRQFCIFIGPQFSYLMAAKEGIKYRDGEIKWDKYEAGENFPFKNFDFGVVCGLDYEFSTNLLLGLTYNIGLIDITKGNESDIRTLNMSTLFTLGYNFGSLIK